jgi:HlyD family secretion protein
MALTEKSSDFIGRHRWVVTSLGVLLGVVLLVSLASMREEVVLVRAATVERSTIRSVISTNGKIEPVQNFEAHAPVNTTVRRILVKEGDHVKKGQLLLQLDDAEARSQAARAQAQMKAAQAGVAAVEKGGSQEELLTLQAQLVKARGDRDSAQRSLDAYRRLQQRGAASVGEVKEAENTLKRAQADLNLLEQKQKDRYSRPEVERVEAQKSEAQAAYAAAEDVLQKSNLVAPFDGIVYSLPVRQGNYVQAGDLLLQEANLSKVLVRAYVDEPDIGRLVEGQKVEITWDAVPSRNWQGHVSSIPATVKLRGARNVGETTCLVDNSDLKLLPNTNVTVTIITAQHDDVLTIPREALRQEENRPYVYQIVGNVLRRRDVSIAASNLTRVEVTNVPQDAVVALNSFNTKPLRDGIPVKVVP